MRYIFTEWDTFGPHTREISRPEAVKALSSRDLNADHTLAAMEYNVRTEGKPLETCEWGYKLSVTPLAGLG